MTDKELLKSVKPLPGKCIIEFDPFPDKIGSLFIPDVAREQRAMSDPVWPATVLAVTPRRNQTTGEPMEECFKAGDRVYVALLMQDLNAGIIATQSTRVWARIEDSTS
jgi:co-chaperonin GroES (HSP10)